MIESPEPETPNQEDFTQEKYRETLDKTYPEDPRFTQEKYRETLKPLTSLEALKEEVEPFNGEETLKAIEGLGEIPKESRKGLSKKSFVLDTLLNFFSSEKESPDRMKNTLEGTIGGTINDQVDVNSQPEVEDTTGFKMPDSFKEEAKAREDATVDSLKFTPAIKKIRQNINKKFKLKKNGISEDQYNKTFDSIKDSIGFLESNNVVDAIQQSEITATNRSGRGPARGYYQYEPDSAKTAVQRFINNGGPLTKADRLKLTDFSKLTKEDQDMFFESDHADRKGSAAGLKKIVAADTLDKKAQALAEYWANVHKVDFLDENGNPSAILKAAGIEKAKDRLLIRLERTQRQT